MMKILIVILFILGCSFINCNDVQPDDSILYQSFVNWMNNYDVYYTSGEMQPRFEAWKTNLLKVAELNSGIKVPDVQYKSVESTSLETASLRNLLDINEVGYEESFPGSDIQRSELNMYSDLTEAEFQTMYAGADASLAPIATAAAVLSTGAIIGIAVGGGAALIGGTAATIVIVKKKRANRKPKVSAPIPQDIKLTPKGGIDLLNRTDNPHRSITARAFYS